MREIVFVMRFFFKAFSFLSFDELQNWQMGRRAELALQLTALFSQKEAKKEHVLGSLECHYAEFPVNYLLIPLRSKDA